MDKIMFDLTCFLMLMHYLITEMLKKKKSSLHAIVIGTVVETASDMPLFFRHEIVRAIPIAPTSYSPEFTYDLRDERHRLTTFQYIETRLNLSLIRLAASGMYYTGTDTIVKCIFCGAVQHILEIYDLYFDVSRLHAHSCTPVSRAAQGNIPIDSYTVTGLNRSSNGRSGFSPNLPNYPHTDAYNRNNESEMRRLGIYTAKPKHEDFSVLQIRRRSFRNSPEHLKARADDFAEAGFFFTGCGDGIRCFHCGRKLGNWSAEDNPWQEHERFSPECVFIKINPERTRRFHRQPPDQSNDSFHQVEHGRRVVNNIQPKRPDEVPSSQQNHAHRNLCRTCHIRPPTVLFEDCRHLVSCRQCAMFLSYCPVCKQYITKKTVVNFS
ncbi:death-associated inhibitor of apoptosis 1-like [Dreissena polymorpha]|nr:death-associated inhibitor of apoptosis 1-like [Dreissena polymorpha]